MSSPVCLPILALLFLSLLSVLRSDDFDVYNKKVHLIPSKLSCIDLPKGLDKRDMTAGAELGVQVGLYSLNILSSWKKCKRLYLVDMWRQQENYGDIANVGNDEQEKKYQETKNRVKDYSQTVVMIRNSTYNASFLVPDKSLDYIFIDARHDYCGAYEDLELWYPKMKSGALITGHDFLFAREAGQGWDLCQNGSRHMGGPKGAVIDFALSLGIPKIHFTNERKWKCFYFTKP